LIETANIMRIRFFALAMTALLWSVVSATTLRAEDNIERAGIITGITVGNVIFLPLKAISVSMGAFTGALSYVLSGGNEELTEQIWRDTRQGPYLITPELGRKAIGERPELERGK
jgi:predicted permease